jgi:DNA polymerase I-like protein with 3'-5' exonuclease and polymerase domains
LPKLVEACARFGIGHGTENKTKEKLALFYGRTQVLNTEQKDEMLRYMRTDVEAVAELFTKLAPSIDIDEALERGRYVMGNALVEFNGIPVDVANLHKITVNRKRIRLDLINDSGIAEIYTDKGAFDHKKFGAWLAKNEITGWRMAGSRYSLKEDDITAYAVFHPALKEYRDLHFALKDFKSCSLVAGPDGRLRNSNCPFGTISGRNKPTGGFIFALSKWWRWLIMPPVGHVIIHYDYSVMEFGIAAYCSGDRNMIRAYESKDVHQINAENLGVTRDEAKAFTFSTQYGGGPKGFAAKTGMDIEKVNAMFQAHRESYTRLYEWKSEVLEIFKRDGLYKLPGDGWYLRASPNLANDHHEQRAATNFAVQGLGATILRRVVVELTDLGIKIIATQHDSITTEVPIAEAAAQEQIVTKVMQDVSASFLNGNPIRVDAHVHMDRFEDQKGAGDWARISAILEKYPD